MPKARTTTAQGNAFRDSVQQLIELTPGCLNVEAERLIGTQPVDLYYEERTTFGVLRVACECKDYGKALTKDLIARNIYPRYAPLLAKDLIDAVRIIAPRPLGSVAGAYVKECKFQFSTLAQLEAGLIDFRQYLATLIGSYGEDGLDQYYVRPKLDDGADLETQIDGWLRGTSSQPIAILAGYGMGKTSFARHLAHRLARAALADPSGRVPILVPLSEISSEQTLEGLLGKLLAARHRIPGYHFSPFIELNRRGRFVVLLDGFDEMKHSISWSDFKHNLHELNRLCAGDTRVILLGRPSALLSEAEELYVLRGQRQEDENLYTVPDAPDYRQLKLAPFSTDEALAFIRRYATYRRSTSAVGRGERVTAQEIDARIKSLKADAQTIELIGRPVQAKMLADLAMDPGVKWRSFTRHELYREFMERISEREARKPTRMALPAEMRRQFMREVAWWMWRNGGGQGFQVDELPLQLVVVTAEGANSQIESQRELLVGSLLEKKTGETFYFPHRSFLEFLVAEAIGLGDTEAANESALIEFSAALTPEVISFIKEGRYSRTCADFVAELNEPDSPLRVEAIQLIAWGMNCEKRPGLGQVYPDASPRDATLEFCRLRDREMPPSKIAGYLVDLYEACTDAATRLTILHLMLQLETVCGKKLASRLRMQVMARIIAASFQDLSLFVEQGAKAPVDRKNPFLYVLLNSFQVELWFSETDIHLSMSDLFDSLENVLPPKWRTEYTTIGWNTEVPSIPIKALAEVDERFAPERDGAIVERFFEDNNFVNLLSWNWPNTRSRKSAAPRHAKKLAASFAKVREQP